VGPESRELMGGCRWELGSRGGLRQDSNAIEG
jgi:hypothetical protein